MVLEIAFSVVARNTNLAVNTLTGRYLACKKTCALIPMFTTKWPLYIVSVSGGSTGGGCGL